MNLMTKSPFGYIAAVNSIIVGDVKIAPQASLWFGAVIRGDVAPVVIGQRTNVQDNAVVHCDTGVENIIGSDVTIGHGAIVHGKSVGDGSLIGMGATVLSRTIVGRRSMVAAGAVLAPDMVVPDGMLAIGVPAKILRPVKADELEYMRWLIQHYVELAEQYLQGKFVNLNPQKQTSPPARSTERAVKSPLSPP
jgi:carbonic anhydrase/acetyltransferase-like protein (isoleucine patch superfamily)